MEVVYGSNGFNQPPAEHNKKKSSQSQLLQTGAGNNNIPECSPLIGSSQIETLSFLQLSFALHYQSLYTVQFHLINQHKAHLQP